MEFSEKKIDDLKKRLDVDIQQNKEVSRTQAKEDLYLLIRIPVKFMGDVELTAFADALYLEQMTFRKFEFDGKARTVLIDGVCGHLELNCSLDMNIVCRSLSGPIDINQISAASTLHIPEGSSYLAKTKGFGNRILYTVNHQPILDRSGEEGENLITLNGINSELRINEYGQEEEG